MDFKEQLFQLFEVEAEQAELILSKFHKETLDKNVQLLQEGQSCNSLSFIANGYCRVYKWTGSKEATQWIGGAGYFVTDLASFLFDKPAVWSIETLSPVTLWTLDKADYQEFEQKIPNWNVLEKRFIAKCFMLLEQRIFQFISQSAEERYQQYFEANKELFNQVPLQYIASVLGMSPETLSRIRSKA